MTWAGHQAAAAEQTFTITGAGAAIIYPLAVRVVRHAEGIDTNGGTDKRRMLLVYVVRL